MNVTHYLRVAPYLHDCPSCKDNKGSLEVSDNLITRECPCGFVLTMNVRNGTSKKKIESSINQALERMKQAT